MLKNYYLALFVLLLTTSCATLNKSTNSAAFEATASVDPIKAEVIVDDTKKITGTSTSRYFLGLFRISGDNNFTTGVFSNINPFDASTQVASAAAYKAIKNSNADVIVNPQYVIEKHNYILFQTVKVKVTGMKGTFKLK
tara:strand:- start:636 stop:1052 length:417 start_codon:yes stop_codon:yes gene_type:complete